MARDGSDIWTFLIIGIIIYSFVPGVKEAINPVLGINKTVIPDTTNIEAFEEKPSYEKEPLSSNDVAEMMYTIVYLLILGGMIFGGILFYRSRKKKKKEKDMRNKEWEK